MGNLHTTAQIATGRFQATVVDSVVNATVPDAYRVIHLTLSMNMPTDDIISDMTVGYVEVDQDPIHILLLVRHHS